MRLSKYGMRRGIKERNASLTSQMPINFFFFIFRELYIDDDPIILQQSTAALISLQKIYGLIPKISGIGKNAKKLCELMKKMRKNELKNIENEKCSIDQLIIFDRSIDLMSILATQLTYEGLIGN